MVDTECCAHFVSGCAGQGAEQTHWERCYSWCFHNAGRIRRCQTRWRPSWCRPVSTNLRCRAVQQVHRISCSWLFRHCCPTAVHLSVGSCIVAGEGVYLEYLNGLGPVDLHLRDGEQHVHIVFAGVLRHGCGGRVESSKCGVAAVEEKRSCAGQDSGRGRANMGRRKHIKRKTTREGMFGSWRRPAWRLNAAAGAFNTSKLRSSPSPQIHDEEWSVHRCFTYAQNSWKRI